MNKTVNCVWIGNRLSIMERLSILLAQKAGFDVVLWSDSTFSNIPSNVIVKQIPDTILKPVGFKGIPHEMLPNGGIGSFSHWSDYFAFTVLGEMGGYWMQLDFAILTPIDIKEGYAFTGFGGGISPVFMKIPKNSPYANKMSTVLKPLLEEQFKDKVWDHSMNLMHQYALEYNVYDDCKILIEGYCDCGCAYGSPYTQMPYQNYSFIHWSNATNNISKDNPTPGSLYEKLLKENNLI